MTTADYTEIAQRVRFLRAAMPALDDEQTFHRLVDDLVWSFGKSAGFNRRNFYAEVYAGRWDLAQKGVTQPDVRGYSATQKARRLAAV